MVGVGSHDDDDDDEHLNRFLIFDIHTQCASLTHAKTFFVFTFLSFACSGYSLYVWFSVWDCVIVSSELSITNILIFFLKNKFLYFINAFPYISNNIIFFPSCGSICNENRSFYCIYSPRLLFSNHASVHFVSFLLRLSWIFFLFPLFFLFHVVFVFFCWLFFFIFLCFFFLFCVWFMYISEGERERTILCHSGVSKMAEIKCKDVVCVVYNVLLRICV